MEDIKKIQEFFSKPLNENKVTKEDFDKVVKILSKSKYPFTIMLVPKWDEIDIITGQDSPDEISDDISQRLDSAGLNWGGNSGITISGDSSNYSRREYSDIFKVNGGHKDYYEESYASSFGGFRKELDGETIENELQSKGYETPRTGIWNKILVNKNGERVAMIDTDESSYNKDGKSYQWKGISNFINHVESVNEMDMNDPVLMKMRAAKDKLTKMRAANAGDDGNDKFFDNAKKIAFLKKEREQLMRDMEQEAEPEGGPIADEYGSKLNRIDKAIAKLQGRKEMTYDQAIAENALGFNDSRLSSDQHTDLDYAVRDDKRYTFGNDPYADDQLRYEYAKKMGFLEEQKEDKSLAEMKVGDKVTFKSGGDNMEIIGVRDMFASDLKAYRVKNADGETFEYSEDQLQLAEGLSPKDFPVNFTYGGTTYVFNKIAKDRAVYYNPRMDGDTASFGSREEMDSFLDDYTSPVRKAKAKGKSLAEMKVGDKVTFKSGGGDMEIIGVRDMFASDLKAYRVKNADGETFEYSEDQLQLAEGENKMPTQDQVDKFFALTQNETHYLNSKPVAGQEATFNLMKIEPWDEYDLSNWNSLVRKAKQQGKSESIAQTLAETIKLGEGVIEEELCPKGKAYIKRRKAAGEKSSAYLSGRAVKVCKGQMSGRKKKK